MDYFQKLQVSIITAINLLNTKAPIKKGIHLVVNVFVKMVAAADVAALFDPKIKAALLVTLVSCALGTAQAQPLAQDKQLHIAASAISGLAVAAIKPDWTTTEQVLVALIPGVVKEISDATRKGGSGFSGKDLLADVVGAYIGVKGGHWLVAPKPGGGTAVAWQTWF